MGCCGIEANAYYFGGGSGAGFIGEVYLSKGSYSASVGMGQYMKRTDGQVDGNSKLPTYVSYPGNTVITGVVTANGANLNIGGTAPVVSVVPASVTLNTAGNNGSNNGTVNDVNGAIAGASVYGGYGAGGIYEAFNMADQGTTNHYSNHTSGNGYLKVIYKHQ